jgi:hypothetical protein
MGPLCLASLPCVSTLVNYLQKQRTLQRSSDSGLPFDCD